MIILNILRGMCMAFADSVPGVSGGTVAFVLGFYNDFIQSLNSLVSKSSPTEKKKSFLFLSKIGVGWVFGFILSVLFITSLFEKHIYSISSLFLGFIIFSIPLIYKEEKELINSNKNHIFYGVLGILIVVIITYFNPTGQNNNTGLSLNHFTPALGLYVFFAGAIAISAMVLPGISGSTLLLIFGLYAPIMTSIKSILTFNFEPLLLIICFGLGILAGIFSTIRGINALLLYKRSQLIYFIIGLMIGSLYAVIMGPTTLDVPMAPLSLDSFSIIFFALGAAIIWGLERLKYTTPANAS